MQKRKLGRSGISIAPFVLGGNVFGWTADEATSFALLDAYVGEGFDAIDTADVYSRWVPGHAGGESEAVIGRWLAARGGRGRVMIATKVGMDMGEGGKGLRRAHIERSAEASLKRLQTDYIDLYQSHADDAETPLDETLAAYESLIKAGKVRAIGASNYDAGRLAEALSVSEARGLPRYDTLQPLYNLVEREAFEGALAKVSADNDVAVIPFFGLASGFLTGKYRSEADLAKSPRGQRVKGYLNPKGLAVLAALDAVAAELSATPAQVALKWRPACKSVS
ncbi:MAG: aldo/keto reductase, partial [Caulobacteraceae bacterium]